MKITSATFKGVHGYYNVYENATEFEATGLKVTTKLSELKDVGDYFQTANGYYLPMIGRWIFGKNGEKIKFVFPRLFAITYVRKDGTIWEPRVIYDPNHVSRKYIDASDALTFAQMVLAGYEPARAYYLLMKSRSKQLNAKHLSKAYFDFLESELLHESFRILAMAELKDSLVTVGADADWFATQLKEIVEDKKELRDLRMYALQEIKTALDTNAKGGADQQSAKATIESIKDGIVKKKATEIQKKQLTKAAVGLELVSKTG
jgi:hypothetical protein